jgi:lysophospholipase L1-like esterase
MENAAGRPRIQLSTGKKVVMAGVTLLLLVLAAEVGARLLFRTQGTHHSSLILTSADPGMKIQGRYVSHPFMPFALRPSSDHTIVWSPPPWPELADVETQTWQIRHNSWGFRGDEVARLKPPNGLRVVCIGGSTTYDTATDGETWTEKLEALLAAAYPDREVEVLNLGMNAASMPFHITMAALLGAQFQPDLVILYAGHNDLWGGLGLEGFRPDYSHRLGHWDDSRRSAQLLFPRWAMESSAAFTGLLAALDRWRGLEHDLVRQIWRSAPPADDPLEGFWAFENGLVTVQGVAMAHGGRMMAITPFYSFHRNEREDSLISRIGQAARRHDIPLLDAANLVPQNDVSLMVDDVHFSPKGNALFADMIAAFIEEQGLLDPGP